MAAELRSPHQRRSDHLSILTRRQPPPQTPGRFNKTFNDCAVGAFDPTFDSDADTEGPASGSSIWRRDFSRIISSSSAASASMSLERIDSSAIAAAASANSFDTLVAKRGNSAASIEYVESPPISPLVRRMPDPVEDSPSPIDPVFSSDEPEGDVFTRDRASSFYGKESNDDDSSGVVGPLSNAQLREMLNEDYDLFYHTPTREEAPAKGEAGMKDSPNPDSPLLDDQDVARDSPVTELTGEVALVDISTNRELEDLAPASSRASTDLSRKVRSYKFFSEAETLTISIVSDETDNTSSEDGYGLTKPELNDILQSTLTQRPRLSSGAVPLFVEEIGHLPRAAIVDGKVQRVKVANKVHGSSIHFADDGKQWFCSLQGMRDCFTKEVGKKKGEAEKKSSRKRKRSRKRKKRAHGLPQSQITERRSTVQTGKKK